MAVKFRDIAHMPASWRSVVTHRPSRLAHQVAAAFDCFIPERDRRFGIRLWDGSFLPPGAGPAAWTLVLNSPAALRTAFLHPSDLALGEAFVRGEWDVEGDLEQVFSLAEAIGHYAPKPRDLLRLVPLLFASDHDHGERQQPGFQARDGVAHTPGRDREAIRYHYDVGNDFYALWLDANLVYSCAYFHTDSDDLASAQEAKLDHICRKLRLRPGERFLDIGCGWGALIMHAARHYGVNATGITISEAQAALARERIAAAGLADRVQVEVRDYRDLPTAWFDKAASVGMAEHVGRARLGTYFRAAYRALKPGGLFLHHAIAEQPTPGGHRNSALGNHRESTFIQKHVFPDGELIPVSEALTTAERTGFEVADVEGLRRHYALTLRHWLRRLEVRRTEALDIVDVTTYRTWRLYLAGAAHSFAAGHNSIFQALLARPNDDGTSALPLTREDLYE
ncbi:MAG: cyclopropane-fatty-acyl-phospholipid synthase family protein [Thermomicrobiales bacterium]